jgi:hypothetical protein
MTEDELAKLIDANRGWYVMSPLPTPCQTLRDALELSRKIMGRNDTVNSIISINENIRFEAKDVEVLIKSFL